MIKNIWDKITFTTRELIIIISVVVTGVTMFSDLEAKVTTLEIAQKKEVEDRKENIVRMERLLLEQGKDIKEILRYQRRKSK